jgi:LPS-assembly lipoprotein
MTNLTRGFLLLLLLSLAACGFHLRGSNLKDVTFGFKSLYVKSPSETIFVSDLKRVLAQNNIKLTANSDQADLVLEVVFEQTQKKILSLSGAGRVQEYQLFYNISLRAYDNKQNDWLPADEISLSRILPYDDAQVLAKEQEEILLYNDMRSDAIAQAMRRLSRAKPQL